MDVGLLRGSESTTLGGTEFRRECLTAPDERPFA